MRNLAPSLEKDFNDECVFNEMIEQHNYNTYSSARYSNARRTMYLALNRRGQSRKVQVRAHQALGKLSTYARVLTKWVSVERVEKLLARVDHAHPLRHHGSHACSPQTVTSTPPPDPASGDRLRCRKRKKRRKKRRRCPPNQDPDANPNNCVQRPLKRKPVTAKTKKLCELDSSRKICQRLAKSDLVTLNNNNKNKKKKQKLNVKKKGGNKDKKILRNNKKSVKKAVFRAENATSASAASNERERESTTPRDFEGDEEEYSSVATTESSTEDISASITDDSEQTYDDAGPFGGTSTEPDVETD